MSLQKTGSWPGDRVEYRYGNKPTPTKGSVMATHMYLLRNDGYSHLPSLLTVLPLGLVFMQSSTYPHTQFSLHVLSPVT